MPPRRDVGFKIDVFVKPGSGVTLRPVEGAKMGLTMEVSFEFTHAIKLVPLL